MIALSSITRDLSSRTIGEFCAGMIPLAQLEDGIRTLITFACTGDVTGEYCGSFERVSASLAVVFVSLTRRPFDPHPPTISDLKPTCAIFVVLIAAHARLLLHERKPLNVIELATLASVDPSLVRKAIATGELVTTPRPARSGGHQIKAKAARAWLAKRNVPGFV